MTLTVRDVDGLERELFAAGGAMVGQPSSLLRDAADWYEKKGEPLGVLDRHSFSYLCECIRSEANEKTRRIAMGALLTLQRETEKRPDRARFVLRFALRRIYSLSGREIEWSGIPIPNVDVAEAQELFEVARGDSRYSDAELLSAASEFVNRFENANDMFGRFAQDLKVLIDVLRSPTADESHLDTARAALVYFVEVADAVSDDVRSVGLLDDALVVRRAVAHIQPGRSVLASYLDSVIRSWPFLLDVPLAAHGDTHGLSEFMVINSAVVMPAVGDEVSDIHAAVIVAPDGGPLPFLIGFVRALAEVRSYVEAKCRPRFEPGERLADRSSGAEVVFDDYGQLSGTHFEACLAQDATHFLVRQPGKKASGDVKRIKPIGDLASLRRSTKESGPLRRGDTALDRSTVRIGPLERLFGSPMPVAMPAVRGRVIVIGPAKASEALAELLTLHGTRLLDVLPMGQARVDEDGVVSKRWTKKGPGGDDLLTVVRSSAEAIELSERDDRPVLAVVGAVRPGSTDATNLQRLAADGIRVLAVVEELDEESQEIFQRGGFKFWAWNEEWLRHVRWSHRGAEPTTHPVAAYERQVRNPSLARVSVTDLKCPPLDDAKRALDQLNRLCRDRDDETLEAAVRDGFSTLVFLCRLCLGTLKGEVQSLERFRSHLQSGARWWPDEVAKAADVAETALQTAAESLRSRNAKHEFLLSWGERHPDGAVVAPRHVRNAADDVPGLSGLSWVVGSGRSVVTGPLLVPAWMGRDTMGRLLIPPASPNVTLALYGPERAWYGALLGRRQRARDRIRELVRDCSLIPMPHQDTAFEPESSPPEPEELMVDQIVDRVRRALILRRIGTGDGGEQVTARLVYFAGGHWAPFGPDYNVNTVTHLMESKTADDADGLRGVPAKDLRSGDRVVMVRGSDRDALRHAVDRELPATTRDTATEWRSALRRFIDSGNTQVQLRHRLAREGCHRASVTIRSWLEDDRIIGPKDALDGTIEAIQRATADAELAKKLSECKDAIHLVRSTHLTVARRLATRVLEHAREWLDIDTPPDQLVEVEERLVLLTVDSIDPEPATVPRSALNRLREESTWFG